MIPLPPCRLWLSGFSLVVVAGVGLSCANAKLAGRINLWKLPSDGSLGEGALAAKGVPIQLTRPQFSVTEVAQPGKPAERKYEIGLEFVPDRDQRYAVRLNPGAFSSIDFDITLGENGALKEVNSGGVDQLGPAIKTIGSFAVALISKGATAAARGASAKGATTSLDASALASPYVWKAVIKALETALESGKVKILTPRGCYRVAEESEIDEGKQLVKRMKIYPNVKAFIDEFHVHGEDRLWLGSLHGYLDEQFHLEWEAWSKKASRFGGSDTNQDSSNGEPKFEWLFSYYDELIGDRGMEFEDRWQRIGDAADRISAVLPGYLEELGGLASSARVALEAYVAAGPLSDKLVKLTVDPDPAQWGRMHHRELERRMIALRDEIGSKEAAVDLTADGVTPVNTQKERDLLRDLERQSLFSLGLEELHFRREALRAELQRIGGSSPQAGITTPAQSTAEEMALVIGRLEALDEDIRQKTTSRAAVPKKSEPVAAVPPRGRLQLDPPVMLGASFGGDEKERQAAILANLEERKKKNKGSELPELIVVVEPLHRAQPEKQPKKGAAQ